MIARTVLEWGTLRYSDDLDDAGGIPAWAADRLSAVAKGFTLGGEGGERILHHGRNAIRAGQVVGVLAADDCTLEILPKIDQAPGRASPEGIRLELVHMLAVVLDLDVAVGSLTPLGWQRQNLLEILIRVFCDKLFAAAHRGLPRRYMGHEEDLPSLRGRLDVVRQFTRLAASPQTLACRFDELSPDTALNRIMKAAVARLLRISRAPENQRRLRELSFAFVDVTDLPVSALRWDDALIDRTNASWQELKRLARLLLGGRFQTTSRGEGHGFALLFEMHALFEEYVARQLSRALRGSAFSVQRQATGRYCLTELDETGAEGARRFMTTPDIVVRRGREPVLIIDTKWKRLAARVADPNLGVAQGDVYQIMAYGRVHRCPRLMLLYPHHAELGGREGVASRHRVCGDDTELVIATIGMGDRASIVERLRTLAVGAAIQPARRAERIEAAVA